MVFKLALVSTIFAFLMWWMLSLQLNHMETIGGIIAPESRDGDNLALALVLTYLFCVIVSIVVFFKYRYDPIISHLGLMPFSDGDCDFISYCSLWYFFWAIVLNLVMAIFFFGLCVWLNDDR